MFGANNPRGERPGYDFGMAAILLNGLSSYFTQAALHFFFLFLFLPTYASLLAPILSLREWQDRLNRDRFNQVSILLASRHLMLHRINLLQPLQYTVGDKHSNLSNASRRLFDSN